VSVANPSRDQRFYEPGTPVRQDLVAGREQVTSSSSLLKSQLWRSKRTTSFVVCNAADCRPQAGRQGVLETSSKGGTGSNLWEHFRGKADINGEDSHAFQTVLYDDQGARIITMRLLDTLDRHRALPWDLINLDERPWWGWLTSLNVRIRIRTMGNAATENGNH
jgi:hypothetical protein